MSMDLELDAWRNDWLAHEAPEAEMLRPDLRRLVQRKGRRLQWSLVGQLLAGASLLAFSAWFTSARPTLEWILWAGVIWGATFIAGGFAIRNSAGQWKALQQSNAAFLDLSRRRCLAELRAVRFGRWFLAVLLAIVAPWLSLDFAMRQMPMAQYFFGIAATVAMAAIYLAWFLARERRTLHELRRLDEFAEELDG
jgi:hypothetical protein